VGRAYARPVTLRSGRRRSLATCATIAVAAVLSGTGCTARPTSAAAESTVTAFYDAIARADGPAACDLLAPVTVEALEDDADEPCGDALLDGKLGEMLTSRAGQRPTSASVAGRQAQVLLPSDVVFLTVSGTGWLITAVGCDERPDRPYDCAVEGS